MARKQTKVSGTMLFTYLLLAGLIFLLVPQNLTNKFQIAFARIFRLPLSIGRNISLSTSRLTKPPHRSSTNFDSIKESRYQNYIANLEQELKQERQKVEKLSGLRNRRSLEGANLLFADIITVSGNGRCEFTINRGRIDGLAKGQFVLADNSIIGTISAVSSRTAQVRLITDAASKVAVKIEGLNAGRLMQGSGGNSATVRLIRQKVKLGENVYADKKPGFLSLPMIAGKVSKCSRNDDSPLLWDITVEPVCDIRRLNSVAVIVMNPQ